LEKYIHIKILAKYTWLIYLKSFQTGSNQYLLQ
jgi:hypothetical protein